MNYINITQQVPYIKLHLCEKCNFWSIEENCQCQSIKEKKPVKKKVDKNDMK